MLKLLQDASGVYDLSQVTAVTAGVERERGNPQQIKARPAILHMVSGAWHATVTDFEEVLAKWKAAHDGAEAGPPAPPPPPAQ